MQLNVKKFLPFLLIIFFCLPLILPFLKQGYFTTHDGEWAVIRLSAFNFSLKDGQIPPRWAGSLFNGFGYPIFIFNYPLPYIIGEVFHLGGLGFVDSIKAVFILSVLLSGLGMFLLIKEVADWKTGLFAALLYLYYPFRAVDLFVRGSIGESLVFAILPFAYWSLIKLSKEKNKKWTGITAISIAFLLMAHNSLALVSLPMIILFMAYLLFLEKKKKIKIVSLFHCFIVSLLAGLCLSCFFWLPALYEKQWVVLNPETITKPGDHFPSLKNLIIPSWGFGQSKSNDSLSFQLGPIHLLFFLLSLFLILSVNIIKNSKYFLFWSAAFFASFFLILPVSEFFWERIPLIAFVSYPWRILVPCGFYLSAAGSYCFRALRPQKVKLLLILTAFAGLFFVSLDQRRPLEFVDKDEMFYITNQSTTIQGDENNPVWVKTPPEHAPTEKIELQGNYRILKQKSNLLEFNAEGKKSQKVFINTVYYPGWKLFVNGQSQEIDYTNDKGIISFDLPAGESQVRLIFGETYLRLGADFVSLIGFTGIALLFIL